MNLIAALIIVIFILVVYIFKLTSKVYSEKEANKALNMHNDALISANEVLLQEKEDLNKNLNNVVHQKKSSEVRLGKIGENLAPFMDGWPWDSNNFRFIGNPIDGIQFTEDEIIFVEIKTGKSRLSPYQAKCRDLIKDGKVRFATFRIGEDKVEIK